MSGITILAWMIRHQGELIGATLAETREECWEKWLGNAKEPCPSNAAIEECERLGDRVVMVKLAEQR